MHSVCKYLVLVLVVGLKNYMRIFIRGWMILGGGCLFCSEGIVEVGSRFWLYKVSHLHMAELVYAVDVRQWLLQTVTERLYS